MDLNIHYDRRIVASILADASTTTLTYDSEWLKAQDRFPISLSMPVGEQSYAGDVVLPWLMNLLPEGSPLQAMTRALGMSTADVLGLIAETGNDLAGALSIESAGPAGNPDYRIVPDTAALQRIINDLPARPFLVGDEGVSMSLAGAQDKLPVALLGGNIAIPVNGAPSTHILKPDNKRLPGSVQNEALCMVLARRVGLSAAPVMTGTAGDRSYLLVDRYDRDATVSPVRRLHQEDFCQALTRPPGAKYEANRTGAHGPSLADMFGLIRKHMTARDINRFLDAAIFNIAVGNVDSHAKNYSILLSPAGASLAPLYDLMSGLAWQDITQNHAQAIGGQRRGRHIHERHWRQMAEDAGISGNGTVQRVRQVTARVLRELPRAVDDVAGMPAGPGEMLPIFATEIATRVTTVIGTLSTSDLA